MAGKPAHVPTDKTRLDVSSMAAVGIPQTEIATVIGIDKKTLLKYYRKELDESMVKANASVAGKLYRAAMDGDVRAQIFWCKTRLGWRETNNLEVNAKIQNEDKKRIKLEVVEPKKNGS